MRTFLTTLLFLSAIIMAYAQPSNPNTPAPIDGGLSLLAAGGAYIAYKKLNSKKEI